MARIKRTELIDLRSIPKGTGYVQVDLETITKYMRELNGLRMFKMATLQAHQDMVDVGRSIAGDSRAPYIGGVEDVVEFSEQWADDPRQWSVESDDDNMLVDEATDIYWSPEDNDWVPEDENLIYVDESDSVYSDKSIRHELNDRLDEEDAIEQVAYDSQIKSPNTHWQDGSDGNSDMRVKDDLNSWNE